MAVAAVTIAVMTRTRPKSQRNNANTDNFISEGNDNIYSSITHLIDVLYNSNGNAYLIITEMIEYDFN